MMSDFHYFHSSTNDEKESEIVQSYIVLETKIYTLPKKTLIHNDDGLTSS